MAAVEDARWWRDVTFVPTAFAPADVLELTSPKQVAAARGLLRSKILTLLAERPACVTELAGMLAVPKGTVAYHVRILCEAQLVRVAGTRQVRSVTERYYAVVARRLVAVQGRERQDRTLDVLRNVVAEYSGEVDNDVAAGPAVRLLRLPEQHAREFMVRLRALVAEYASAEPVEEQLGVIAGVYRRAPVPPGAPLCCSEGGE